MGDRVQRIAKSLKAIGWAAIFLLMAASGDSPGQTTAAPQIPTAPPSSAAIRQAEVAARAMDATGFLSSLSSHSASSPEIELIRNSLTEASSRIDQDLADTANALQGQPTLATLEAQQLIWQRRQLQLTAWLRQLTKRAVDLGEILDRLSREGQTWTHTRTAARAEQDTGPIQQQVEAVLSAIQAGQAPLLVQHDGLIFASFDPDLHSLAGIP